MNIFLSLKTPPNNWDKSSILSINEKGVNIHLTKKHDDLEIIQIAAKKIKNQNIKKVNLIGKLWNLEKIWHFWQGYRNAKNEFEIINFTDVKNEEKIEFYNRKKVIDWVCNMINLPSNQITPLKLIHESVNFLKNIAKEKINYSIIEGEDLLKKNYIGVYKVGCSSYNKPGFLTLDFNPTKKNDSAVFACLVGKGITFDSGGYSLKNNTSMMSMKSDMSGAAILVGSLALAIILGLKKRIKLYLCCAENMISNNAIKLGDVIKYRNGKSVEINNTDAEGRLVLADGLIDASIQNPQLIIDAATLTGAARVAVGSDHNAIFSFDSDLLNRFIQVSINSKELFWPLPLLKSYRKYVSSCFADLSNVSNCKSIAGASSAAAFLSHFVKKYKSGWIHIDCSSAYYEFDTNKQSIGATGNGIITIANFLLK